MFTAATNTSIHGGTFQSANNIIINHQTFPRGLEILEKCITPGAFHNSAERFDPPKCYPNTREAIKAKIEAWVKECPENGKQLVLWMYGPAGAGKSAIAQSIAELCEALLAASFFFSRTAAGRSDNSRFVATIVWQLIQTIPEIREIVLSSLELDPTLLSRTPASQMQSLIVDPLNQVPTELLSKRPYLVIIDGLDECFPPESQVDILRFISKSLQQLKAPLYFLIASRPHSNIREAFTSNPFRSITRTLPLENDYQSTEDICHFLTSTFGKIRAKHVYLPSSWPNTGDMEVLVQKSSGQFIYAATVIRYITRGNHGHEKRLNVVLEAKSPDNSNTPFAELDALYLQIFQSVEKDVIKNVMEVLGALIFLKKYRIDRLDAMEGFFNYRPGELLSVMEDILSLVHVPDSQSDVIKIYHASLPDFLLDPTRSQAFFLDPATVYLNLAQHCIENGARRFCRDGAGLHHYILVFSECIFSTPSAAKLGEFLLEFNLWDFLRAELTTLFDITITETMITLLQFLRERTTVYEAQLPRLDSWIYEMLLSVPQDIRPMGLVSFDIYFKLKESPFNYRVNLLSRLLYDLGSKHPFPVSESTSEFLDFIIPRIFKVASHFELPMTDFHYTEFAVWCAKRVARQARNGKCVPTEIDTFKMEIFASFVYLIESLTNCEESHVLVDLLKCDGHIALSSSLTRTARESYIVDRISQYIERCDLLFKTQIKGDNNDATESPPAPDTSSTLSGFISPEFIANEEQPARETLMISGSIILVVSYAILVPLVLISVLPWHFLVTAMLFTYLYKRSIL